MNYLVKILTALFLVLLISHSTKAQTTVILGTSKDTYISRNAVNSNYGNYSQMTIQRATNPVRAILDFDLSSIPPGAIIMSAELRLTKNSGSTADTIFAYPLTEKWIETEATWNRRVIDTLWTTSGGTYNSAYLAKTSVGSTVNTTYSWDMLNIVQAWHSGTINNNGIILIIESEEVTTPVRTHSFYTKESTYHDRRPQLVISYDCGVTFDMGTSSTRCQKRDTIVYTAHDGSNEIYYGLDINSLWAGNYINPNTGEVIWTKNWVGESTITATSVSCTSTHTVTTRGAIGKPVFILGDTSYRCAEAGTKTYEALANYRDSTIYSLDAASLAAGNTIDHLTGTVTYVAEYVGTSIITANSYGCDGVKNSSHIAITDKSLTAVDDYVVAEQDVPIIIDVLANDVCTYDASTLQILTQPANGIATLVDNKIRYTPDPTFFGNDVFTYRICQSGNVNCSEATVHINVEEDIFDACVAATRAKTFYIPFPESASLLRKSLISAAGANYLTNDVRSVLTIKITYPGTIIVYDHWEDGYETDIISPVQRTTMVWGDGNPSNGVAPGYPNDIIPPGGYIVIDNQFKYNDRDISVLAFDGMDKLHSTNDISVSKIVGDAGLIYYQPLFSLQTVKTNVYDADFFGKDFIIPLGENVTNDLNTNAFKYTGLFVRAMKDGTLVRLDYDGNGTYDVSKVLNEGEVWFYDGTASMPGVASDVNNANDIKAGAILTATEPIGVDLIFGGLDTYGTRNISVMPDRFYGSTYYCPVYTTNSTGDYPAPVYAFFTNPSSAPITVNWTCGDGATGNVIIPAKGYSYLSLANQGGYKFESAGGETYTAMVVIDADTHGSAYDWAFNLISADQLTPHVGIAWAPGSYDNTGNFNPIWVTSPEANTLYIKYDGNLTQTGGNISPCYLPYDTIINVAPLEVVRLYHPTENGQDGMAIYSCNKKPFSAVWGQDAGVAPISEPGLDVGYSLLPRCFNEIIIANDDRENTDPNTSIEIDILINDASFLCAIDKSSISTAGLLQPQNGTIVINPDHTITYTPNTDFIGTDYFEYSICSQEYPGICDIALVTINVVPCQANDNQNVVKGRVYVDRQTYNHSYDIGEKGAKGVKVNLYYDANCNGTIDPEDAIEQTTLSDVHGNFSFITYNGHNAKDTFDPVASFGGNSGSISWSNNWSEQGENDGITEGNVQVINDIVSGNNAIRLSGANKGISRSVIFDNATSAILKFNFRRQGVTVPAYSQSKNVNVKLNGNTIYQITTSASKTDDYYTPVFIPLSATQIYGNSANTLQFITEGNVLSTDYHWIDDIELIYFNNNSCYITKADPTNTNGTYLTDTTHTNTASVQFSYIGECSVRGYLSVLANLVANRDSIAAMTNYPVVINVLSNDTIGNPDPSTVTIITNPLYGTATVNPDGTITYTANEGYVGIDSLEYRVCSLDDPEVCSTAFAVIYPYPRDPVVTNNSPICHNTQAIFTISGNEGDIITYNINGGAPQQVVIPAAGIVDVTVNSATADQTINLTNIENKYGIEMPLSISSTVQVYASSVAGTASHNQTICNGSSPAALTLTGYNGSIQWQFSTDNVTYTNIAGANSASYSPEALTQTTYYRAEVTVSGCSPATSDPVTITVNSLPKFIFTKVDSKCFGDNNGEIEVTAESGSGLYIYYLEVESPAGSGTYTTLQNSGAAKSTPHTFINLEPKNYRVRVVDTNGCEQINCN